MNLPLRFCVSCGRAVTSNHSSKLGGLRQIVRAGTTKKLEDNPNQSNFDLARKSYGVQRGLRQFFLTLTYILGTILLYLVVVSYCMKDPEVARMINGIFSPKKTETPAREPVQPAAEPPQIKPDEPVNEKTSGGKDYSKKKHSKIK